MHGTGSARPREEFQEHGRLLHSQLHEESLRIPMGFRFPKASKVEPRTLDSPVGLVDVMPTVLGTLGIESPPGLQGRSLVPLISGDAPWKSRPLFFISTATGQIALQDEDWKLIYHPRTGTAELYDRAKDPAEARDLAESRPSDAQAATSRLRKWFRSVPRPHRETLPARVTLDEETVRQLEALGYSNPEGESPQAP